MQKPFLCVLAGKGALIDVFAVPVMNIKVWLLHIRQSQKVRSSAPLKSSETNQSLVGVTTFRNFLSIVRIGKLFFLVVRRPVLVPKML